MQTKPAVKVLALFIAGVLLGKFSDGAAWLVFVFLMTVFAIALTLWFTLKSRLVLKQLFLALSLILASVVHFKLSAIYFPVNHVSKFTHFKNPVKVTGIVVRYPEPALKKVKLTVAVKKLFSANGVRDIQGKILVSFKNKLSKYAYGDEVFLNGKLRPAPDRRNPGEFDFRAFLAAQGIYGVMTISEPSQIRRLSTGHGNWVMREVIAPAKNYLQNFIQSQLPAREAALLQALLIGYRGEIPFELREAFTNLGVVHILAVSGLHVGFVMLIFMGLFGMFRLPYRYRVLLTLGGLLFYALLTNLKPPVVRASLMGSLLLTSTLFERKTDVFNVLALSALIILILNPLELFQAGFQLSFSAVLSIVFLYPKFKSLFMPKSRRSRFHDIPIVRHLLELLFVSMAAFFGTLPFMILYFNRLPNFALLANVVIIPLVFCGIACGMLAALGYWLLPVLAGFYSEASWFFLHVLIGLVEWGNKLPLAYLEMYQFWLLQAIFYVLGLLLMTNLKHLRVRRWLVIYVLALANLFVWRSIRKERHDFQITYLDVGQGDAALLKFPKGQKMLIDGGPRALDYDAGRWVVAPYLIRQGIQRLDAVVVSHTEADHLGGVPYLLRHFEVREVWDNGQFRKTALQREYLALVDSLQIKRRVLRAGTRILDFAPVSVSVLHPTDGFLAKPHLTLNDGSLTLKFSYGEVDFLFVGDVERQGESQIVRYGNLLASEVLKIGHHGSQTSSSPAFLKLAHPKLAVISVGQMNKFGHPDAVVLNRLRKLDADILRTDESGAIILKSDGKEIRRVLWR